MLTRVFAVGAIVLLSGAAWAQVNISPRVIRLGTTTCREFLSLPAERRDRMLIYLNGYLDGISKASSWDESLAGQRIERALAECTGKPDAPVLRVFTDAWAR